MSRTFFVWFLVSIFYAYQYILRVLPNIIAPIVLDKFHIGTSALGQFSGLYYVGYTLAHIPLGILLDKYGPKMTIPVCILMTCLGMVPMVCSDVWLYSQIGRIIVGVGSAASALGIFKIANMYYSSSNSFARMVGLSVIIGLLGAMYGGLPVLFLLDKYGWNSVFIFIIIFGLLLAIVLFLVTPDENEGKNISNDNGVLNNVKDVICNKKIILVSLFGGFLVSPLEGFSDGWATTFLLEVYRFSKEASALLPSIIFFGMGIGSFVLAYISEKSKSSAWNIIILCSIAMLGSFLILLFYNCNVIIVSLLFLIIGIASAYQILVTCKALSYVNNNEVALGTAVSNMIIMIFGYFFHMVISEVINLHWDGTIIDGQVIYGKQLLIKSMFIIPIGLFLGLIGFVWLKYTDKK